MKCSISYFLFFTCLMLLTPLYAGTQTLITYYPAPNGFYKKLHSTSVQLNATTRSDIEAQYNCSYSLSANPCPAGIMYFDKSTDQVYVSTGSQWQYLPGVCAPETACSKVLNCGTDSCGNSCGPCAFPNTCSSAIPGIPGTCNNLLNECTPKVPCGSSNCGTDSCGNVCGTGICPPNDNANALECTNFNYISGITGTCFNFCPAWRQGTCDGLCTPLSAVSAQQCSAECWNLQHGSGQQVTCAEFNSKYSCRCCTGLSSMKNAGASSPEAGMSWSANCVQP